MKTTGQTGLPSSELTTTIPLCPGLSVLTVPLELNSSVRAAPSCSPPDPQELGETAAFRSPREQSGSKVTSLIVPSSNSRAVGLTESSSAGAGSPDP